VLSLDGTGDFLAFNPPSHFPASFPRGNDAWSFCYWCVFLASTRVRLTSRCLQGQVRCGVPELRGHRWLVGRMVLCR
jgi:hypothetical protein